MNTDLPINGSGPMRLTHGASNPTLAELRQAAVQRAELLAEDVFHAPQGLSEHLPAPALHQLHQHGLLLAPLPPHLGGLGLGTTPGGHAALLRILASVGGADLALGRLYEGHVNGLLLVVAFGSPQQQQRAAADVQQGRLFGVWNTGDATPMHLVETAGALELHGCKTFATGAGAVERPIITAEHHGWQMTLPRMETAAVANTVSIDRSAWQPLGMASSESFTIHFDGARLHAEDLIGAPGDFYRDPFFRGGAIRFAAVQAGAMLRLKRLFAEWLRAKKRELDPYQVARLGEIDLLAQEAVLWIQQAAGIAEQSMFPRADHVATAHMVRCGNMTRLAIARSATALMAHVVAGVGAHGLLQPARFERIVRDLTMYLRQPNPDGALADLGRSALFGEGALLGKGTDLWGS